MTDKMTLITLKDTGHVLAALSRAADPEATLTPAVLAGEYMSVRYVGNPTGVGYGENEFQIKADQLDVAITDLDADVITTPRSFYVDADKKVQPADASGVTSAFTTNAEIRITVAAVPQERKVRVEIIDVSDPTERQAVTGKIALNATQTVISLRPLKTTSVYEVLTLVQTFMPDRRNINTP
jgi:hypothetical protein